MKKRVINCFLIALAISLSACGGESKSNEEMNTDVGQEMKDEIIELEVETANMDSLKNEIDDASEEVDNILEEL
ncbi:MAG: hypothetical protein CMP59_01285 [Flavobacteriales bacterium]|nr:hypothetical protein [Flavobacteriales bacterium]|tara:strand:- start:419 stop:640 length:222 start_codon:yes stop_codon:yes gene_type:complete